MRPPVEDVAQRRAILGTIGRVTEDHVRPPPFHPHRPRLVAPVRIDPTGATGPTRGQSRGPHWRSRFKGWHVPTYVERTVEQRIVEAAALIPEGGGAVTGWAALRWLGGRWFSGGTPDDPEGLPVDLWLCSDIRPRAGLTLCEERWRPGEATVADGLPITIPVRSVAYGARHAPSVREATRFVSMAAYDDLVSLAEMAAYAGRAPREGLSGWNGIPQCRKAVALAHENAWSPQEVTLLLIWQLDADLPRPLLNQPIFDRRGRHLGTPDLLDVEAGVACDYDGVVHLDRHQRAADLTREEVLRNAGLEYLTIVAAHTADRGRAVARLHAARRRARWQPEDQRAWTVEQPPWWVGTETVAQRRALTADQRSRFLRYRRAA